MTNTQKVATENANQKRIEELRRDPTQRWPGYEIEAQEYEERTRAPVTKTTCRECGFSIQSENAKMVACPNCSLIQWAGPSCINRSGDWRQCVLAGHHTGQCDFRGARMCKTHKDHAYTVHSCGCQFCDLYWKSCPRCFGRDNFEANLVKEGEDQRARSQGLVQPGVDKYGNETEGA